MEKWNEDIELFYPGTNAVIHKNDIITFIGMH